MKNALFAAILSVILGDAKTLSNSTLCPFPAIPHQVTAATRYGRLNWENRSSLMQLLGPGTKIDLWCNDQSSYLEETWTPYIYCKEDGQWDELPSRCYESYSWKNENVPIEDYGKRQDCASGMPSSNWTRTYNLANIYHLDIGKCGDTEIESVSISGSRCHQEANSSVWSCDAKSTGPSQVVIQFNSTGKVNDVVAYHTDGFCGYPPVPAYGDVIEPLGGSWDPARVLHVSYRCNKGYELVGEGTNQCDPKTGHWSTASPKCQLKLSLTYDDFCGQPPAVENGSLIEPQTFDSSQVLKVSYKCASGYELIGNETIYCHWPSGQWSSDAPTCHRTLQSSSLKDVPEESASSSLGHWIGGAVAVLAAAAAVGFLTYVLRREFRFRRTIPSQKTGRNLRDADLPTR